MWRIACGCTHELLNSKSATYEYTGLPWSLIWQLSAGYKSDDCFLRSELICGPYPTRKYCLSVTQ